MKKLKQVLALTLSLIMLLTACGGGNAASENNETQQPQKETAEAPATSSDSTGEKTKITIWHHELVSYRIDAWQYVIDKFNAANPDVEVVQEAILWADAMPKLLSSSQANVMPEINQAADAQWSTTYVTGLLLPVDDVVEEIDAKEHFYPDSLKSYTLDGHTWGVPISSVTIQITYRPSILKELGYEKFPETWSEFEEFLEKATLDEDGDGVPERYGIGLPASRCTEHNDNFLAWLATMDNGIFDEQGNVAFNNEDTIRTAEFLGGLMKKYSPPNILSMDAGEMLMNFTAGKVACMAFLFPDLVSAFKEGDRDIATAPLPRPDDVPEEDYRALVTTHALNITKAAEDPVKYEACKRFIQFCLEPENIWVLTCGQEPGFFSPPTETGYDLIEQGWFNQEMFPLEGFDFSEGSSDIKMFQDIESNVAGINFENGFGPGNRFGPVNLAATEINGAFVIADMMHKIVGEDIPVEEAVAWAQSRMEEISDEVNGN